MDLQMKYLIKGKVNAQKMKGDDTEFLVNSLPYLMCTSMHVAYLVQSKDLRKQNSVD